MSEEDRIASRLVGAASRAGLDVERIKRIARARRKKVSQVIAEAIELYEMVSTLDNIDTKCLAAGLAISRELISIATQIMGDVARMYSTEIVQAMLSMYNQAMESAAKEGEKERKPEALEAMKATMIQSMINMVNAILSSVLKIQIPTAPSSPSSLKGVKIIE